MILKTITDKMPASSLQDMVYRFCREIQKVGSRSWLESDIRAWLKAYGVGRFGGQNSQAHEYKESVLFNMDVSQSDPVVM